MAHGRWRRHFRMEICAILGAVIRRFGRTLLLPRGTDFARVNHAGELVDVG